MATQDSTCTVVQCDNPKIARGWCSTHYRRWMKHGSLDIAPTYPKGLCAVPQCGIGEMAKGLCASHYARNHKTGETGPPQFRTAKRGVVDGRKQCFTCETWKLLADFNKHPQGSGGVGSNCRLCLSYKSREWFAANPNYRREWNTANVDRKLSNVHARRAKYTSADAEWVDRREVFKDDNYMCQLCGTAMDMSVKTPKPLAPTLDHIVPISKGGMHTRGNVTSAHFHCNISKGNRERPLTAPATA